MEAIVKWWCFIPSQSSELSLPLKIWEVIGVGACTVCTVANCIFLILPAFLPHGHPLLGIFFCLFHGLLDGRCHGFSWDEVGFLTSS